MEPIFNRRQKNKDGSLTFAGVLQEYWKEIAANWAESTQRQYYSEYNSGLLPNVSERMGIESFDKKTCDEILQDTISQKGYAEGTKRRYRHLIRVVIQAAANHKLCEDFLKDSIYEIPDEPFSDESIRLLRIKKSMSVSENLRVAKALLSQSPEEIGGEQLGLLIMFLAFMRNGEACGLTYSDIRPLENHSDVYCLWISKSTQPKTTELQIGGKTKNAPRCIPIPTVLADYLLQRKSYLEREYKKDISTLRIVCHNDRYSSGCQADDLGRAARKLFEDLGFGKMLVRAEDDMEEYNRSATIEEREPTAYLLRRNGATMLCNLGLSEQDAQYYIGHAIEDPDQVRNDYIDSETLYRIWERVEENPINMLFGEKAIPDKRSVQCVQLPATEQRSYLVEILASEAEQPIQVRSTAPIGSAVITVQYRKPKPARTVDIVALLQRKYLEEYQKMEHSGWS